jgi:hypothetical protein
VCSVKSCHRRYAKRRFLCHLLSEAEPEEEEVVVVVVMEWWRWVEMKVGFWIMDFHVLQTEVQVMMDLIGNRRRIWVTISTGKEVNSP